MFNYNHGTVWQIPNPLTFFLPFLEKDSTLYVAAVRGLLAFRNSLFTLDDHNVAWNGCMFDVSAKVDVTIDSLSLKIESTGMQGVEVFYKTGTHIGFELQDSFWTFGEATL
ncbi:MAG: hypothetical protein IH946_03975 [Bacteroidetes bacterium]|nr:hypothetical protein [Bacteroidota bacterium]